MYFFLILSYFIHPNFYAHKEMFVKYIADFSWTGYRRFSKQTGRVRPAWQWVGHENFGPWWF